ncbi:MAG: CHAD domain-containing protein [Actinobacteria bacterium]|nr:CHAD domain-containing protein [Actinomycetota bacterium]
MEEHATKRDQTTATRAASNKRRSPATRRPSGKDIQEVEWQFDDAGLEEVEEWLKEYGSGTGLSVAPGSTRELTDTYLDTEAWRLHRAGYALRVRRKGSNKTAEATMKSLASTGNGSEGNVRRREISERVRNGGVGFFSRLSESRGPVGERLRALVGSHEMRPLFEIRTHRQTFNLMLEEQEDVGVDGSSGEIVQDATGNTQRGSDGSRVGEVALDATKILLSNREEPARLSRVEVEVVEAEPPTAVFRFVKEMRCSLELDPTTVSKYEAGLSASGLIPDGDPELGPMEIDASMNTGEVALAILRRQFAVMRSHEPGSRLGEDAEELHDMRVATRRMRAALKLFSGALPERASHYREELKWVAGALGEVRDLDVQIEQLQALVSEAVEEYHEALEDVVEAMEERREETRGRMLETLNSGRYERFVSSFAGMLRRGPDYGTEGRDGYGEGLAAEPIVAIAPDLVSRRHRKWRKVGKRLKKDPSPEYYHELRKEGKKLRYALEFLADVYGEKPTGKLVGPLKELQDGLGRHQDSIVAAELFGWIVADGRKLSPRAAFEMGILSERYLREAADLRASLPHSRPYCAMTKNKTWGGFEKAMEKQRKSVEKTRAKTIGGKKK